ncbi:MAG: beta-L-arabinofuranosidase domain-containing protein [Victivallales bacterium]
MMNKIAFLTAASSLLTPLASIHAADNDRVLVVPAAAQKTARSVSMEEVPLAAVRIHDNFWLPKLKTYRDNLVPVVWPNLALPVDMLKSAATPEKKTLKGDHPYIEGDVHKILEAASCSLVQEPSLELERRIDELIAIVGAAQQPGGDADAYVTTHGQKPWSNTYGCQEDGYVTGFLIEGAVAHYRTTGKKAYLDIACKAADSAWRYFVEQKKPGFPGHAGIEPALAELYRVTGDVKYLDLLRVLIEARGQSPNSDPSGYHQAHLPIRQQNDIKGHAVRAMFFATGVADLGMETGDKSLCDAARRLWTSATKRRMYVTGGVGSRPKHEAFGEDYELPNREGYCESCANCGLMNFAHRMLCLDGDAEAADVLELSLYNSILHGISLDGKSTYSYATPLSDANHSRESWGMCCPSTLYRTLMQVGRYVYGFSENDIYVNLFVGSTGQVPLKAGSVPIRQETEYPWDGVVLISVEPEKETEFALHVRIPGWSNGAALLLNGKKIESLDVVKGYAVIRRSWRKGDTIQVDLPMPVRRVEAHPNVIADSGKVTIQRGPIVYGVEASDNDGRSLVSLPSNPWFQIEHLPDLLGGVTLIQGKTIDGKSFQAIPFYALANRGISIQEVWLYQIWRGGVRKDGWEGKLYREYLP